MNNMTSMWFIVAAIVLAGALGIYAIIATEKKKRTPAKQGQRVKKKRLLSLSQYSKIANFYDENFLTRDSYRKVKARLADLSVYTAQEIMMVSVRFYSASIFTGIAIIVLSIVIFTDIFSVLLVTLFAIVMLTIVVDKQIDGVHFKILKQLSKAFSDVRQNYLRTDAIPDAIVLTAVGSELQRAFEDIYLILTTPDGEERLEEFYASTPFKLLQTFAGVCYILNDSGDTKLSDGSSSFVQAMSMMASEVNLEIRKIHLQKAKFGILEYLPIAPLPAIAVIQDFFTDIIPGTTVLYNGTLGYISRTLIILSAIVGYVAIVRVNSAVGVKKDDRNRLVMWLLKKKWYYDIITNVMPKTFRKIGIKFKRIKGALSSIDLRHLYGAKVLYAVVAFVSTIAVLYLATDLGRDYVYRNVREVSLVAGEELTAEDIKKRQQMDEYYLSLSPKMSERDTAVFVQQNLPRLPAYDQEAQVKRLLEKYDTYYNTYFKWYFILIAFGISYLAWNAPEWLLLGRTFLLRAESQEDVLQLQTIIAILMNTTADTLETLYWLERQSRVHKNILLVAYHEYPSNPELALGRAKRDAVVPEFHRLVDKLTLTIHQITLAEAFSDLVTEREHTMRIREVAQETAVKRKRMMMSPLSLAPLALVAVLYLLLPIGILGFKEFVNALSNIG